MRGRWSRITGCELCPRKRKGQAIDAVVLSAELVQMLVALVVQDDTVALVVQDNTQGGAGAPTQSTQMDHDRRDEVRLPAPCRAVTCLCACTRHT